MADSQINALDKDENPIALDSKRVGGKETPQHGVRDGMDEALGAMADVAAGTDGGTASLIALIKRLLGKVPNNGQKVMTGSLPVVVASDQSAVPVAATRSASFEDVADVTLNNGAETLILAADGARREAILVSDPANTANLRLGKTGTVDATNGALLQPGGAVVISSGAAIYGYAGAAAQKLSISVVKD
jgi:hypothetical protein